jgi:hypothetical protein
MARSFQSFASVGPSTEEGSYIYKIVSCASDNIAGITSADELFLVDASRLGGSRPLYFDAPPKRLTSLLSANDGQLLVCAGGESVHIYDARSFKLVSSFEAGLSSTLGATTQC